MSNKLPPLYVWLSERVSTLEEAKEFMHEFRYGDSLYNHVKSLFGGCTERALAGHLSSVLEGNTFFNDISTMCYWDTKFGAEIFFGKDS